LLQFVGAGDTHVEVTVGAKDHTVVSTPEHVFQRGAVGQFDASSTGCGTSSLKIIQGGDDLGFLISGGGWQHQSRCSGIDHDRYSILLPHVLHQQFHRFFHQWQLVGIIHRTGHVEQKDQIAGRRAGHIQVPALQADMHKVALLVPGADAHLGIDAEGMLAFGLRIVIAEIVDHFLGPDRVGGRKLILIEVATDGAIGSGIDVDGKGGQRLGERAVEDIGSNGAKLLGVPIFSRDQIGIGISSSWCCHYGSDTGLTRITAHVVFGHDRQLGSDFICRHDGFHIRHIGDDLRLCYHYFFWLGDHCCYGFGFNLDGQLGIGLDFYIGQFSFFVTFGLHFETVGAGDQLVKKRFTLGISL